jgi:hypothetical protein
MRNLISGIVGTLLGAAILLGSLLRGGPQGEGAYQAGQFVGLAFGVLFFFAGLYYLYLGWSDLQGQRDRPGRRKKKRPPVAED